MSYERISTHAVDRFRERHPDPSVVDGKSDRHLRYMIHRLLEAAEEVKLHPRQQIIRLLAHGKEAIYLERQGWVFTVVDEIVVTAEHRQMYAPGRRGKIRRDWPGKENR